MTNTIESSAQKKAHVRVFNESDTDAVIALWGRCGLLRPWNDPQLDIMRKQSVGADLFLVAELDGEIVAAVMGGYDGHRGWMNYLGVDPGYQQKGYARLITNSLECRLKAIGCPKINLQVRHDNNAVIAMYERLGYSTDSVLSMGKRLIPDAN